MTPTTCSQAATNPEGELYAHTRTLGTLPDNSSRESLQPRMKPPRRQHNHPDSNIPVFQIDLSLPPRERYKALARAYHDKIQTITPLFNALLSDLGIKESSHGWINGAGKVLMRGLYEREQTEELRGIRDVTGVEMYLLVALNVVLDLLMGCTSGCVRSSGDGDGGGGGMLHFRTLDWSMDPLREIIVRLDFVRSATTVTKEGDDERRKLKVIASSITYVGFVGVLTGVRKGLSLSLNFRPMHNAVTRWGQFRFYFHHVLVLLGLRPSISSLLRDILFENAEKDEAEVSNTGRRGKELEDMVAELAYVHTTAAYVVFCDGQKAIAMEKDYDTAAIRQGTDFVAATNHDVVEEMADANKKPTVGVQSHTATQLEGMKELLDDSKVRMDCVRSKWEKKVKEANRIAMQRKREGVTREEDVGEENAVDVRVSQEDVIRWVRAWPTTNESTHFAAVMDPTKGEVVWGRLFADPVQNPR